MAPLTLQELQKAQAIVDGFAFGPMPALNPANLNTQDREGNPQVPSTSPAPYYPPAVPTPLLELSLYDMSSTLANNFVLLDKAFGEGSSINVNGSLVESPNLNKTTPAAPVGDTNVSFQIDDEGNISAFVATADVTAWSALTGDLRETQVIPFDGPTIGTPDSGISRIGAGSLAIGDGTSGDTSGSLTLSTIFVSTVDTFALSLTGTFTDSTGHVGTIGQVLESTVTGTQWITPVSSGFLYTVVSKTSNYLANSGDDVWCNGTFNVTLPSPTTITRVKVSNRGTGSITVVGIINGVSNLIIARQYSSAEFASDGTNWGVE